ncbi:hypothetical protein C0Q70_18994 [Pomacea canaliculata]|uniref:G-patch domain-containing protein n=1 Tax=Pomacea canaliculata TaxID=400727 RepID=A0A2T7NI25_POMCA|nr:hypothetical protein C0Q70_18994 [Pomacea canaliculata]
MAASSDSEEENFVELGEPLPFIIGDGNKKPIALQAVPTKETKGRPRFHGAFTGGFSAGYFNTVGTKEGWAPSTFVSSRSKKQQQLSDQLPEDFMDEEAKHGIAPRKLVTSDAFTSEERNRKRHSDMIARTRDAVLPVTPALIDLIVPEKLPIGIKLLRKMGWKEGQGIGPRQKAKKPKRQKAPVEPGVKMYGCALPPLQDGSENEMSDSDVDLQNVTFAPKDVAPIKVISKDNVFGLGYHGLDPTVALPSTHINLFEPPAVRSSRNRKGIRGQAFGVGALEEEDEDIYAVDSLSNYDQTMEINDDQHFGWTAPGSRKNIGSVFLLFMLSSAHITSYTAKLLPQKKVFPPPTLPCTFRPFHRFRKTAEQLAQDAVGDTFSGKKLRDSHKQTAVDRGLLLGETPLASSVFDLIPKADIKRMEAIKEAAKMTAKTAKRLQSSGNQNEKSFLAETENSSGLEKFEFSGSDPVLQSPTVGRTAVSSTSSQVLGIQQGHHRAQLQCLIPDEGSEQVPVFQGSLTFKPFRKDPAKQDRYDKYVALVKQGVKDPYEQVAGIHMTEWEKQRERKEFSKAAEIYRPLSSMMASRFTRGAFIDDAEQTARPAEAEGEKSERVKAAEMKIYGQLTREDMEWHPHNLLCKRFNVPNPYPGSETVGLLTVKRDKLSVFNFLSFPMDGSTSQNMQPKEMSKAIEELPSTKDLDVKNKRRGAMSVFSVLEDQPPSAPESVADNVDVNDVRDQQDEENEEKAQPTDLFRAIFKNSDSESSTSDEKSDDEIDKNEKENFIEDKNPDPSGDLTFVAVQLSSRSGKQDLVPHLEEQASPSQRMVAPVLNLHTSPTLPASEGSSSHLRAGSRWSGSIFDVLDDSPSRQPQLHQQSIRATDLEQRLSTSSHPSAEDDCYGPALPPTPITSTNKGLSVPTEATIGMTCKSHRKQKHKHRHKDDKASPQNHHKKKKSKHKKKKRQREKKDSSHGKRQRNHDKSSASEADAESELGSSS